MIYPLLPLLGAAFAAAWIAGWTGFLLWLLGATSALIAYQAAPADPMTTANYGEVEHD